MWDRNKGAEILSNLKRYCNIRIYKPIKNKR